jgi:hypothetical protein
MGNFKEIMESIGNELSKIDWTKEIATIKHMDDDFGNSITEVNICGNYFKRYNIKNPHTKMQFSKDGSIHKHKSIELCEVD